MATKHEIFRTKLQEWLRARGDRHLRGAITRHVCFVTGMHPKSIPRAFRREQLRRFSMRHRGRPIRFGPDVTAALKDLWEAASHPCGELLFPIVPEYVAILRRDGQWTHDAGCIVLW